MWELLFEMYPDFRNAPGKVGINLVVPETQNLPALPLQGLVDQAVPVYVTGQFLDPKLPVVLRDGAIQIILPMPKGAIAEDRDLPAFETDVGCTEY